MTTSLLPFRVATYIEKFDFLNKIVNVLEKAEKYNETMDELVLGSIFSTRFECSFHNFRTRFECSFYIFSTRFECSFHIQK